MRIELYHVRRKISDPNRPETGFLAPTVVQQPVVPRSEEHTSELQSLMRISYAVFCLKKKKKTIKSESTKVSRNLLCHKHTPLSNYHCGLLNAYLLHRHI